MKCSVISGMLLLLTLSVAAQKVSPWYKASSGRYMIRSYASNIVKVTYVPDNYRHGENVSDAVMVKPSEVRLITPRVSNDTVYIFNKPVVTGVFSDSGFRGFTFPLHHGEMIFGAGERAVPLNRRGYRLNLYNNPWYGYAEGADNLNFSVPFIISSHGYGLYFDNPSRGFLDIGKSDTAKLRYGASSGEINVYIIFGNVQQALRSFHRLTGTQPLPPRWAFGNLMSRFGYTSEAQVKSVYEKMKSENIPVDAVIFDLFWFGDSIKGTLGNLEWVNKTKWPDPRRMIGEFRKEGVHTILVTEPFFVETSLQYRASRPYLAVDSAGAPFYLTDFYFGKGGLIDIFRKDAQEWFWQFHRRQMQNGVEGWWGDLGEPEKHPAGMYHNLRDLGHRRLFAADEVHNLYGHTWTKMLYNRFAAEYPDKRLFSLNRSGFAGSQRYGIIPWTGDVSRSWSGLRAQLPVLLGMTMSGIPYVHSDAGGFAGGEGDGELYVRWLQFAAFTPVFRPHGTALYEVEPAAASFPSEPALMEEPWRSHARQAVQLRYLFLPYNYSLAYQQTSNGTPLMAPLYYYYFNDTAAMQVQDQYMWGRDMMVAPILDKGATERKVYLPAGRWLNIFSSTIHQGGQWITVPAQLTHIPVFAREGSFVPTVSRIRNISEYTSNGQFLLSYFPSRSRTTFTWFEDDGVSRKSLPSKNYTLIRCTGQDMGNRIVTEIRPDNQKFVPVSLVVSILIQKKPASVMLNGRRIPVYTSTAEIPSGTRDFAHWMPQLSSVQVHADMVKNKILQIQVIK